MSKLATEHARRALNEIEAAVPYLFDAGDFQEEHFYAIVQSTETLVDELQLDLELIYGTDFEDLWEAAEEARDSGDVPGCEGVTIDLAWLKATCRSMHQCFDMQQEEPSLSDLVFQFLMGLAILSPADIIDLEVEYSDLGATIDFDDDRYDN